MCQAWSQQGYDVTLLAPHRSREYEKTNSNLFDFYGVQQTFVIKKLWWPYLKGKTLLYALSTTFVALRKNSDIVYGRFLLGCYFAALLGCKVAFELHSDLTKNSFDEKVFKALLQQKKFFKLVVISQALKEHISQTYNINGEKIFVAHDGADIPRETKVAQLQKTSRLNVGYVGQLYSGKGMELIVAIADQCPYYNFHIVGGSESDISHWKDTCQGLSNVIFYGYVPHSKTAEYINAFDVVLAPYQDYVATHGGDRNIAQFMSPLKIFEYMASQKVILASRLPVLQEVLKDTYNALLCDSQNINEWVAALQLVEDDSTSKEIANQAYKDFIEKYTWSKRAESITSEMTN
jgi:glycosyltransferase involved in cell wall biosynthesis